MTKDCLRAAVPGARVRAIVGRSPVTSARETRPRHPRESRMNRSATSEKEVEGPAVSRRPWASFEMRNEEDDRRGVNAVSRRRPGITTAYRP